MMNLNIQLGINKSLTTYLQQIKTIKQFFQLLPRESFHEDENYDRSSIALRSKLKKKTNLVLF